MCFFIISKECTPMNCYNDERRIDMAKIAYIRVSTDDQNTARQEELFEGLKIDKTFIEKASGANIKDRIELQKMMDYVREGDVVLVESISRFGRSLQDLLFLVNKLNEKGVQFKSLKEGNLDTTTPSGKLIFSIFSSLAEFERETIKQRQKEGIAIAKAKGVYKGRARKIIDENELLSLIKRWKTGEIKKTYICKKLSISKSTLDRRIKEMVNN